MTRLGPAVLAALALSAVIPTGAAPTDATGPMVDAHLQRWEAYGFSGALLVARDDAVLLNEGYGLARREEGTAIGPQTVFDIGSLSKQFTATAILALVDDGRLKLHEPIRTLWPELPADKGAITPHHLLTHTSGVEDFDTLRPLDRQGFLRRWSKLPVTEAPGKSFSYSNVGYTLLAAIVEEVAEEPFERFVRRRLFEPAGLKDTAFVWETSFPWPPERVALGYGGFGDACAGEDPRYPDGSFMLRGSGGVLSTVSELYRWSRALERGAVLDPKTRDLLFRAHTVAEVDYLAYGYGWRIQTTPRGTHLVWHTGLEGAFNSVFRRYADEDLTVVFLSNQSIDGVPLRNLLLRPAREGLIGNLLFGGSVTLPPPVPRSVPLSTELPGAWQGPRGSRWQLRLVDGAARLRAMNQSGVDALFPPDDRTAAIHAAAGARARELAEAIAGGDAGRLAELAPSLDRWGYGERPIENIAGDWQRAASELGPFREVREVATSWIRQGPPQRTVTHLRIVFEKGTLDEKFLVWADDETYLIPCAPDGFELWLGALDGRRFVAFDPVTRRSWTVLFAPAQRRLEITEIERD